MWKTKLGYCIYTSPSGYKVYQNFFYRWLTLGSNALQTVIDRKNPQKPILYYLPVLSLMARHYPGNSCLLGLGGAALPHLLKTATPHQSIIAVERSDEIIDIAQRFFMTNDIPMLQTVSQNAAEFIKNNSVQYQHLIVDLYDANHFPEECMTEDFFGHCCDRLKSNGFLSVNLANSQEQWPVVQSITKQFKTTIVVPIKQCANIVLIASKNINNHDLINQLATTGELKKFSWNKWWGTVGEV